MSVMRYRCPESGKDVTTAIETGANVLIRMCAMDLSLPVWCPHCMSGHQIKALDTFLDEKTIAKAEASLALA
jgi:hypothetical protein